MSKNGKAVDPSTIDWSSTSSESFNYAIVQGAGGGNSLGRMKFMFPNRFAVYLHDTPSQGPFERKIRAVSHGCVRLHKPIDFALYCTSNIGNALYRDRVLYSTDRAPESVEGKESQKNGTLKRLPDMIYLDSKIPLTIDYYTVFIKPDSSELCYTDDVYNLDSRILSALNI
jgi:murein L,D-transpeptidase YcbB/YkuD